MNTFNHNYEKDGGFSYELRMVAVAGRELNTVLHCMEARPYRDDERMACMAALQRVNSLREQITKTWDEVQAEMAGVKAGGIKP